MLAELLAIQIEQPPAVLVLFRHHFQEHLGGGGIVIAQPFGDVGIDAAILLLAANGEGQDFAFAQVGKIAHGRLCHDWPGARQV